MRQIKQKCNLPVKDIQTFVLIERHTPLGRERQPTECQNILESDMFMVI